MGFPKVGMYYDDVKRKLKGPLGHEPNTVKSLLRQVNLHEGGDAVDEIAKDVYQRGTTNFSMNVKGEKAALWP